MTKTVAFIGFGEAGQAFAGDPRWSADADARAFDVLTNHVATRGPQMALYTQIGIGACETLEDASAPVMLSLVTADQALLVATDMARLIQPDALFLDLNSVAPQTKRAAADRIDTAGGRYVDVAVMAPVHPARLDVPLLVSGPHAEAGVAALSALGFTRVRHVPGPVGRASSIKMIRSVIVKGIEALTAEAMLAADRADVVDEVLASLGGDWATKADYNLDRMMVHGVRRAAEMEEVVKTLVALDVEPAMTRGTVSRQREIGSLGIGAGTADVPQGLAAKLEKLSKGRSAA
jgi:3-hydroxyisobutyrate dehydrogenase-like beta-hydroxyacid dehydrogenase